MFLYPFDFSPYLTRLFIQGSKRQHDQIRVHAFCLPSHMTPYYNELRATGSHGWHTGFCCVYMVLVVGFGDEANGQRDSIQENTEDGIDGMIG